MNRRRAIGAFLAKQAWTLEVSRCEIEPGASWSRESAKVTRLSGRLGLAPLLFLSQSQ
jgi:hypothetical protein